jgi:branched-chain amino acid transport system permease protein
LKPAALLFGLAVLVVLPFVLSDAGTRRLATVGAYFIAIVGLDVLVGQSGRISLGHGAFMGVGAYTTAILMANHGVRDLWTIPAAAGVAGVIGLLAGVGTLRLSGRYLVLVTFGIAVVLPTILEKFDHFTGGSAGISLVGKTTLTGHGAGVWVLTNNQWLYVTTWAIAATVFLVAWWLLESRFGRSVRAIRDNELAAVASGVNRETYKLAALGVSAAFAGIAGALLAIDAASVAPGRFPLQLSLYLVVGAVAGFFGSIWGAALGALLIEFLPDVVGSIPHVDTSKAGPAKFFFGLVLVVLMLAWPVVRRVTSR